MQIWSTIAKAVARHGSCAAVTVVDVRGSAPRETGARMVVLADGGFYGTIGGGSLEWNAIAGAREALAQPRSAAVITRVALGPTLGQCCGGSVRLLTEVFRAERMEEVDAFVNHEARGAFVTHGKIAPHAVRRKLQTQDVSDVGGAVLEGSTHLIERFGEQRRCVYLFGAGHVGRALMLTLAPLPFDIVWIDQRRDEFPSVVPANVRALNVEHVVGALSEAPAGSFILVMTHSHALDLEIVHSALTADRFDYVGLIGSQTKRARFVHRLRAAGVAEARISALVCPIGIEGIRSKRPAAIALSVAAQLTMRAECANGNSQQENLRARGQ